MEYNIFHILRFLTLTDDNEMQPSKCESPSSIFAFKHIDSREMQPLKAKSQIFVASLISTYWSSPTRFTDTGNSNASKYGRLQIVSIRMSNPMRPLKNFKWSYLWFWNDRCF